MSYLIPAFSSLQSTEIIGQGAISGEFQQQSPHPASIHIVDDDSLLNIFYLYRLAALAKYDHGYENDISGIFEIGEFWDRRQKWWYKLAQVCQRWRNLILGSASHLGLCLFFTHGRPVADMLAHSPPVPFVVDYGKRYPYVDVGAVEKDGIIFALEQRDRVRCICFRMSVPNLQKALLSVDGEYPVLEFLLIEPPWNEDGSTVLMLPVTFQAPRLRRLLLSHFALPMGLRLFTAAVGLVTLILLSVPPSSDLQPNILLQWLSFMPLLEEFNLEFSISILPTPNEDVETQLMHTPIMAQITLPNLRSFSFDGTNAFMEALVHNITAPRLERLSIGLNKQSTFSVQNLLQFMNATEYLKFDSAMFEFLPSGVYVNMDHERDKSLKYTFSMAVYCSAFEMQVSSIAHILNSLGHLFYAVEHLYIFDGDIVYNEADRADWRKLFRSFSNAKTLLISICEEIVEELSRVLRPEDGEHPLELLPELQRLVHHGGRGNDFKSFLDARQNAGRPVKLVLRTSTGSPPLSESVTSGSGEAGCDLDT